MAASGQGRELPKLNTTKSTKKPKREIGLSLNHQDESELISDADITPKKSRRKSKSPSKRETVSEKRGYENPDLGVAEDGQNTNTNNSTKALPSQTPRKKKRVQKPQTGYSSTHSLQSGQSLPLSGAGSASGGGDVSESNPNETSKRTKRKRRRKTATSPASSGRIESLGVSLAEIEDDIVENGTDAETDSVTQVPHRNHMKSQPIGKLYIEQSRKSKFKPISARIYIPKNDYNQPVPVDWLTPHLHFIGKYSDIEKDEKMQFQKRLSLASQNRLASVAQERPPASSHLPSSLHRLSGKLSHHMPMSGDILPWGFKSAEKKVMEDLYAEDSRKKNRDEDEEPTYPVKTSSMAFALMSIHVYKIFAHFCMGLLAGLAIWQTLYTYSISRLSDTAPFLEMYRYLSVPINCVFYIGLVICTVATFDRYDVSKITRPCLLKAFTLQSGAVAALLYVAALCVNVSMAPMDDRLGPWTNGTMDTLRHFPNKVEEDKHLAIWRILAVVRAVFIGLAWFIISLQPSTDRLSQNLGQSEVTWGDNDEKPNNVA